MVFNSFTFAIFFGLVLCAFMALRSSWRSQKTLLLASSYIFYGVWNPALTSLLALSTVVDWFAARWIANTDDVGRRKRALLLSLTSNLGLLFAFKYGEFFLANVQHALSALGITYLPPEWDIVLPVGISFYTFQTLSYTIDVYRGRLDPKRVSFLDFALFVSFFPQLVAGPIVRASDFLPQLRAQRNVRARYLVWGMTLVTVGLFEKTVLADSMLAQTADTVFAASAMSTLDAWVGAFAFSGQIFFDFAGYSTCAIGVAMCFGFRFPDNFAFPYGAIGFSDFWRRWHISLSTWLRDYLYISLGGNRGSSFQTYRNLFLTMLIGGFWHGASWNFVLWGALHGAFLIAERLFRRAQHHPSRASFFTWWLGTQLAVLLAWVPFRASTIQQTMSILGTMVGFGHHQARVTTSMNVLLVATVVGGLYLTHLTLRERTLEDIARRVPALLLGLIMGLVWVSIWLANPGDRSFIYFQF